MSEPYEVLYNRILDATATFNIPIKIFVMFVVVRFSTPEMRSFSLLLLNGLFWNFMANLIFVFLHLYPMYPAECFRADGMVSLFSKSETFGHIMFCVLFFCILNCVLALAFTFPYRYMIFAHPITVARLKKHWIIAFFAAVHVVTASIFVFVYIFWVVPSAEYPIKEELLEGRNLFCFMPYGPDKDHALLMFLIVMVQGLVIGLGSTFLLLLSIHRASLICNNAYLQSHKRILWTLIWITCIPLFIGAIPLVIALVTAMNPHIPYAKFICMVSIILIANHGTAYAIALIIAIKPFRIAVQRMVRNVLKPNATSVIVVSNLLLTTENRTNAGQHLSGIDPSSNILI
uniref:G_PROTEIN_RECEP_F1_2 domain-containing protein n=1 Tax=Steinernema glaseri TaxID=37863 RepID=A0A1I7ZMT1_9BILA